MTHINVSFRELEGDQHTPISIFMNLEGTHKFLLESSLKHEDSGRYSFIGSDPFFEMKADKTQMKLIDLVKSESETSDEDPFTWLKRHLEHSVDRDFSLPFPSGGIGYFAYDVAKRFEAIDEAESDDLEMPDIHFLFYNRLIVYDHLMQKIYITVVDQWITNETVNHQKALYDMEQQLAQSIALQELEPFHATDYRSNMSTEKYEELVKKARTHIEEGDIFQVVLSQRLSSPYTGDPFSFYRKLRKRNPSPYMFYIDFNEYVVLGASPESLIKVDGRNVTTNPIAGTRKRGKSETEDRLLSKELLEDEKEIAEHQMLVDLGRNDVGRISKPGTIQLSKYMLIERYRTVMHIVSEVKGVLDDSSQPIDALIACLPAGTVSGAPKIRAMQLINEMEKTKRGVYSGAVGYLGVNGNLDLALAIRTMVLKDGKAHVQAGAGVVYDSVPENEFEETLNKAKSLLEVQ
ncbi:anthranilate synthase component I [Halalkalibacillus sediminis]|uniref:Anthranilate synthase component 1 n=1 Tax=Halalkalibacillus sediminis TaxID=2018042 RepID=A0A2I0QS30_9BACI|nr:anthranilate synthase component I [Halalkalibacillus sediminis]PKR77141.1 anthranilate synthase component I [Halalkalibacillus sediminis]